MKNLLTLFAVLGCLAAATAQEPDTAAVQGYRFTDRKTIETTPVKNQNRSGTCWCFSTMTFLESEILRAGGEAVHLSEMWIVRHTFLEKAERYIRMHGTINFAEGGTAHDVTEGIKKYGIVPFEVYRGLNYGTELPDFNELTPVLKAYLDGVETRLQRPAGPVFRRAARDLRMERQTVYAAVVRRIAADRLGGLHRPDLLHAPPLLHAVRTRNSRQLDVGRLL